MSPQDYASRMQEIHEGHNMRVGRLATVAAGHAKHNAAMQRALVRPRGAEVDPEDLKVLYEMAPEEVTQSVTADDLAEVATQTRLRRRRS